MPFTKDDLDAVSITLLLDGDTGFQISLTRAGLTQRMGFSERRDPSAIMLEEGTDVFEPFMGTVAAPSAARGVAWGKGLLGILLDLVPILVVAVPVALGPVGAAAKAAPTRS